MKNHDPITLERIETAHPFVREVLRCIYFAACALLTNPRVRLRFTEVKRSKKRQLELWDQGRYGNQDPIVTWTKLGFHQFGLAVDICLLIDHNGDGVFEEASWNVAKDWDGDGIPDWMEVVKVFQDHGWDWGIITRSGKHIDKPHFQRSFGFTPAQLDKLPKCTEGYPLLPGPNNIQKAA